jgi:uncharacterized membrane protein
MVQGPADVRTIRTFGFRRSNTRQRAGRDTLEVGHIVNRVLTQRKTDMKPEESPPSSSVPDQPQPRTVEDVTARNVQTILHLEQIAQAHRSHADHLADVIARFCGSMTFVWVHVVWFSGWIILNAIPGFKHIDPYPFTFLTLMVSLEAIFLSTFILISQNMETRLSERRNHLDLQINLLAEQENTKIIRMLELISQKVGAQTDQDPDLKALDQSTRPETLVEQIEQAMRASSKKAPKSAPEASRKP